MRNALVLCLSLSLLAGCAGDGPSRGGGDSGRRPLGALTTAPPTARTFSGDVQAFMRDGLHQFSAEDPRWEQTRAQWIAMGPRESEFLVQNLWAALLAAQSLNQPQLVERARHELALIGPPSVPLLSEVLRAGSVPVSDPGPEGQRIVPIDDMQRAEASEILSLIGEPAAAAVAESLRSAESKGSRRACLATLGNMGERGGEAARSAVLRHTTDADDVLRIEAVRGLRNFRDDATRNSLFAALGDPEPLVVVMAAESLVVRKDTAAAPSIRAAAASAQSAARLRDAKRLERFAEMLEAPRR